LADDTSCGREALVDWLACSWVPALGLAVPTACAAGTVTHLSALGGSFRGFSSLLATYERILERLPKTLDRLSRKAATGVPVIVEGKKDVAALARLGIYGITIAVKGQGMVLEDCLDAADGPEAVVFVDFDEHGTELAKEITRCLESRRIKVDMSIWREVRGMVRKEVKDIEGLPTYLESLKKRVAG
jgi:5S rRNA maturation endonuclease (ribonuclease M5)